MKEIIFQAGNDWTGLIIRLTLGIVLFPHGAQKTLGWFGGPGLTNTMTYFSGSLHLPWFITFLVILIESLGVLCLVTGFAGRLWGFSLIILFLGTIVKVHQANGFFMNWTGTQPGEGFEYHLLVIGLSIALLINGSGRWSLDQLFHRPLL
jgi:putative oxidoreductase